MKKFILLSAIFLFAGLTVNSARAQIGLRGGVNLSSFIGSDAEAADDVMGLNAGLSLTLLRLGPVSVVPEIYYAQKGAKFSDQIRELQETSGEHPELDGNFDLRFDLAYVELPVLLKINLPFLSTDLLSPYISGGPVYAWRIDCSFTLTNEVESAVEKCADENFPDLQTTFREADKGFAVGTGMDLEVPYLGVLTLDARYVRGLERLREGGENSDIQNRSFTLMLGYSVGF